MAIFTAYDHAEILTALQDAAPHAEIHTDDKVAREHSANGNAQQEIAGTFWHTLQWGTCLIFRAF